ncbi:isochorismate synthase [Salinadaptatus halalkaliphilus]|uniref:isochorismate synthase n=1 Tax=Salinadaptatus halalkaliphilus TaxID=2419781 RepID=A0A4S3TR03_9EURY|nr:isochorismate synthase [Salinadaptatus halalkaliphilus]THE64998.1 isochorismate synthase [Salinadaptatus halalkaliphilus]
MDRTSGEKGLAAGVPPSDGEASTDLVSYSRELEDVSLRAIVDDTARSRIQWAAPDGLEIAGRGTAVRFTATGADRFTALRTQADTTFDSLTHNGPRVARPRAFGGFAFHDTHDPTPPWSGFEAASFVVPRLSVTRSPDGDTWLTAVDTDPDAATDRLAEWAHTLAETPPMQPVGSRPGVASTRRPTSPAAWADGVTAALDRIDGGDLTKVVLAQSLSVRLAEPIEVPDTLERLRREYPNCYRFLLNQEGSGTFFGAPPEQLVSKRGDRVDTEALAGSVPRGETPEADDEHAERMLDDDKLRHEHDLVVDAIRTQLAPFADDLTVADRTIRRLATIQHLHTPIAATIDADSHVLELVEALHPTPAVGGVPPDIAWQTIRRTEPFDRGWYAAPIGWFDGDGDGEFAVGLRSGVATDETVTLFAGNGIVADSDPAEEWDEVQLKFRPVLDQLKR